MSICLLSSYHLPKKPFFKCDKAVTEKLPDGLSPGKRIQYRSECIDQLAFINERGVISVDEFKSIIMITLVPAYGKILT